MPKAVRTVTAPNLIAIAHLMKELQRGVLSMPQLAEVTGLNINTVQRYCAALHKVHAIFIAGWERDARGAQTIRIYQLGEGVDVAPEIVTKEEKARRLRETRAALRRQLARGEVLDDVAAQRARQLVRQRVATSSQGGGFTAGEFGPTRSYR